MLEAFRYKALFENSPENRIVTDLVGLVVDVNASGADRFGVSREQLVNTPLTRLIIEDDRDRFLLFLARLVSGNFNSNTIPVVNLTFRPDTQQAFRAALSATPVSTEDQELAFISWTVREDGYDGQEQISATQTLISTILGALPVGVIISDAEGNIIRVNPRGQEILGSDISGTLEKPIRPYQTFYPDGTPVPPADMPLNIAVYEGRSVDGVEVVIRRDDGSESHLLSSASPVYDEQQNLIRGVAIFQDITNYRDAEQNLELYNKGLNCLHDIDSALLEAESVDVLLASTLPLVCDLIPFKKISLLAFESDAETADVLGLITAGESFVKMGWQVPMGGVWPPEELSDNGILEIKVSPDFQVPPELTEILISDESDILFVVPLFDRGRLMGTMNVNVDRNYREKQFFQKIILQLANHLAIGIRQARLMERQKRQFEGMEALAAERGKRLTASEARFRTVFEEAAFGIALLDENGLVLDLNKALQNILGYSGEDIIGKHILDFGHSEDVEPEQELFDQLIHNEIEYYEFEGRFVRGDGEIRWGKHIISRVKEEKHEESTVAIALVEDFTERVLNQEALLRTERFAIAGRLGASLAHEINNPLQAVLGSLGLIDEMINNQEARRFLDVAMNELERAANIVEQLRDMGKPIVEKEQEIVDLNSLIEKTLILTKKKRENSNIELNWDKKEDLPKILVSSEQIQQVLLNLIMNAIQAMESGGTLEIFTELTENPKGISTFIKDDGIGFPSDGEMKLFEPFYSTRPEGLGLGLYISHQIIKQHKGKIHIESEEGAGAAVSFWLPITTGPQK